MSDHTPLNEVELPRPERCDFCERPAVRWLIDEKVTAQCEQHRGWVPGLTPQTEAQYPVITRMLAQARQERCCSACGAPVTRVFSEPVPRWAGDHRRRPDA